MALLAGVPTLASLPRAPIPQLPHLRLRPPRHARPLPGVRDPAFKLSALATSSLAASPAERGAVGPLDVREACGHGVQAARREGRAEHPAVAGLAEAALAPGHLGPGLGELQADVERRGG